MALTFDVAVVGGGIAGVSAALASHLRGARTCLVRAAPGATALASGAWAGPVPAGLREQLAGAGYPLIAVNRPLAHERGHTVQADFAAPSHANATAENGTLVCGFVGLPHFNAQTLARIWNPAAPVRAHTIELAGTPAAGWSAPSLAAFIERDPAGLIAKLQELDCARVILPAVLGIERTAGVAGQIKDAGIEAAEALAATPSLPGWRLQLALDRLLTTHGVTVFTGRAALKTASAKRVEALAVANESVVVRSVVLATGKYLAGGLSAMHEFRETVLDLPVWLEQFGDVLTTPDPLTLTDPVRTAEQPILTAGVHTDDERRPVDRTNHVVFENVFVAGTIRAGWSATTQGLGYCAEDGWAAGERASA